jgi:hypothetical protein
MVPAFTGAVLGATAVACAWKVRVVLVVTRVTIGAETVVEAWFTVKLVVPLRLVEYPALEGV